MRGKLIMSFIYVYKEGPRRRLVVFEDYEPGAFTQLVTFT